jgi:hypothetical protein
MIEAYEQAERELKAIGRDLNNVPQEWYEQHLWADGILMFWVSHKRLPTPMELALDMFDEWDDPVSTDEAEAFLRLLRSG